MLNQIDQLSSEFCKTKLSNGYVIDFALKNQIKQRPAWGTFPKTQRNGGTNTSVVFIEGDKVTDFNIRIPGTDRSDMPKFRQLNPPCRVRVYFRLYSDESIVHIQSTQSIDPEAFIDYLRQVQEVN